MANLSQIRLEVGSSGSSKEFAKITGIVSWSGREQQENLAYVVRVNLFERDDARDILNMLPDGTITRQRSGDEDDTVGFIGSTTLFPNNQSSRPFEIRRDFDFGYLGKGTEAFYAVASVTPEIRGDFAFSNEVRLNV